MSLVICVLMQLSKDITVSGLLAPKLDLFDTVLLNRMSNSLKTVIMLGLITVDHYLHIGRVCVNAATSYSEQWEPFVSQDFFNFQQIDRNMPHNTNQYLLCDFLKLNWQP